MHFTLIIPTINRPKDLEKTLESIKSSSIYPNTIIIVDQSENNQTKIMINQNHYKNIHYLKSNIPSGAQARNLALQYIDKKTEIIIFLDDDVTIDTYCFENIITYLKTHHDSMGGVLNINTPTRSISLFKKIGFFLLTGSTHFDEQFVTKGGFNAMFLKQPTKEKPVQRCSGCGMFVRKKIIDEGIRFPQTMMKYSLMEDVFFSYAIHRKYPNSLIYLPQAKIIHHESPHRSIPNYQKIRQQVIHRFLFIKKFHLSSIGYLRTIVCLRILDIFAYHSFLSISKEYLSSLIYVWKNRKNLDIKNPEYNKFIFD